MNFLFLRLRDEFQRERMFRSLSAIGAADLRQYEVIYSGPVQDTGSDAAILEGLFRTFNIDHPADFQRASMSVSDIVILDGMRTWFCDNVGWVELKGENAAVRGSTVSLPVTK